MLSTEELKKIRSTFNNKSEVMATTAFKALGDVNRHRIFLLLSSHKRMTASNIAETLKLSRPLASQHLKILEQANIFKKEKVGQHMYYQLDKENNFTKLIMGILKKT